MSVLVVDYGMGNIGSVRRAVEECGHASFVSSDPSEAGQASHIILPGVGSFTQGMKNLTESGWAEALGHAAMRVGVPLLGICLGMQLLAEEGTEGGNTDGLGFLAGRVTRLMSDEPDVRIPHIGWNELHQQSQSPLWKDVPQGVDMYFVHSYHLQAGAASQVIGTTPYCGGFVSAVQNGNIVGLQFHPEKSQKNGLRILANFLDM